MAFLFGGGKLHQLRRGAARLSGQVFCGFASQEMKMLIAQLLLKFEIEWPQGKSRPPSKKQDFAITPDVMAEMMFRRKVV